MTMTQAPALSSRRPRAVCLAAALAALPLLNPAFGATTIPSPEKLLPDDTLAMVTAPDFARMRVIWNASPQTQLWSDPAMKPFKDKFVARWKEEFIQPLERDLGVRFDDYSSLPQGQVTLALTQNGWHGTDDPLPALLLLLDARDKSSRLKSNLADLRKKWVDAGKTIRTEKVRDIEFSIVPLSDADTPKTLRKFLPPAGEETATEDGEAKPAPAKRELVIGQFESLLIVGSSLPAVERVVVRLTGGSMPALGDLADYEANRLSLFRDAPGYGWVNLKAFLDVITRKPAGADESETPNPFALMSPEKILAAMGLSGLKTLAFNFQSASEGSSFRLFVGAPESGRQGILKIFPAAGKDAGPPAFVPGDVVKFQRCRLDGQKAWATLQTVMNNINPQLLNGLNFLLETANTAAKEKDPGFDLKQSLFGNLGDDLINYQKAPRGTTPAELMSAPSLLLIGSPKPEQLATALRSVLVLMDPSRTPTEREFLGRKIYSVPLPAMPLPGSDPDKPSPRSMSYACSGGYVALSADASILEEFLRSSESQQKTLRQAPGFTEAMARAGGTSTGWAGYENQAESTRLLFEALRKGSLTSTNEADTEGFADPTGLPALTESFKAWMDFSLLPPFEKVSKYFHYSVFSAGANAEGFTFNLFAPTPPGLKKQP